MSRADDAAASYAADQAPGDEFVLWSPDGHAPAVGDVRAALRAAFLAGYRAALVAAGDG